MMPADAEYMKTHATKRVDREWLAAQLELGRSNLDMARELGVPRDYVRDARKAYGFPPEKGRKGGEKKEPDHYRVPEYDAWPVGVRFEDDPRTTSEIGLRRVYGGVVEVGRTRGESMT